MKYEVGYNRPVKGAFGNSPVEWYCVCCTDDLEEARRFLRMLRADARKKPEIIDTEEMKTVA